MTDQHPITPPQWQIDAWAKQASVWGADIDAVLLETYRAGADQELEACCEWIHDWYGRGSDEVVANLRAGRRPKPPSLAEQALKALTKIEDNEATYLDSSAIHRALKRLQELEGANG